MKGLDENIQHKGMRECTLSRLKNQNTTQTNQKGEKDGNLNASGCCSSVGSVRKAISFELSNASTHVRTAFGSLAGDG